MLKESWGSNVLAPLYDNHDSVCGIEYNGSAYFFVKNLQGDVISIANSSGTVVARYTYDAWGACTVTSDTSGVSIATINPYRYRSYYYDIEIGLYYLQSRYYDPVVGRFINGDDVVFLGANGNIASYNLFTYCENDAINRMDPNGYDAVVLQYKNSAYGMGHISAMVQNSKGDWYYFYWGSSASGMYRIFPAKAYVRLKSLMWKGEFRHLFRNVKTFLTYCDEYNEEPIKYSAGLTDWIYIPGNFADTYNYYEFLQEEAMSDNRIYNLYMFNCKHAVMQGLHFSVYANRQSPLYEIFLKANAIMIPNNAFNYLKRTINSYYLLYMVGYHALTYLSH